MSCYKPIEAYDVTLESDLPKRRLEFNPNNIPSDRRLEMIRQGRRYWLPCRHCVGCRLDHSREWANRVVMEQLYHDDCWFLTLTYDDEHLPSAYAVAPSTGEILSVHATLVKSDLQDFLKRLRKNSRQKIRYFAAGEYGTGTYRPHYHLIIFGLHLDDVKVLRDNFCGQLYFTSDFISSCWPAGYHILGKVTWQSAAYVARYTMKKATHGFVPGYYKLAGIEPEFQTMSLKPAIGRQYYDDHPEIFEYSTFNVSTLYGGRKMVPPEYFRKLHRESHPLTSIDELNDVFNTNLSREIKIHLKLLLTDNDYYDILSIQEDKALSRITGLIRDSI